MVSAKVFTWAMKSEPERYKICLLIRHIFDWKCRKKCYALSLTQWKSKPLYKAKACFLFFLNLISKKIEILHYCKTHMLCILYDKTRQKKGISFPQFEFFWDCSLSHRLRIFASSSYFTGCQSLSQCINTAAAATWLTRARWIHCFPNPSTCYYSPPVITAANGTIATTQCEANKPQNITRASSGNY